MISIHSDLSKDSEMLDHNIVLSKCENYGKKILLTSILQNSLILPHFIYCLLI